MSDQTPDLWKAVTSYDALLAAWTKVDTNEGSSGGDGVSRGEFRADRFARLNQLRAEILTGEYKSRPFRRVSIPKKKPGYRILTIPAIRDRILHTSIASALVPILESIFEESSFGYRPGRGVTQAVARIEHWRDRGYSHVIEADIVRFFDHIEHDLLLEKLEAVVLTLPGAQMLTPLIKRILEDQATALGTEGIGLVQGSPLSPLLANLYLDALDEEIESQGVKLVRFADDFVILCKSVRKAERVLAHCAKVLGEHGLRLHEDGTRIVSFEKGFDFIGNLFLRTLALKKNRQTDQPSPLKQVKSEVTEDGIIQLDERGSRFDQGKRVLYVLDPLHILKVRNRSFSITRNDGAELIAIPHRRIGRIEVGPDVKFGRPVVDLAMETHTDLALLDGFGQTKGNVMGRQSRLGGVHLAQARAVLSPQMRTTIAKRLVVSRIRNQRTQLARLNRKRAYLGVSNANAELRRILRRAETAQDVETAMGFEGAATSAYWTALGKVCVLQQGIAFKRSRPARDPLNAAINYFTGILERDIRAAIQTTGLHQGFAFLHGTRDRHGGLVFDMMEPFRAPLTEGLSVFLFNARRLKDEMFSTTESNQIEISALGRRALVEGYEAAVSKRVNKPDKSGKLGWRAMMVFQCRSLSACVVQDSASLFQPYLMET